MAHIDDLVKQVGDPQLRAALMQQVATLTSRKQFGLVFQEHSPESVRLPQQRVRSGDKVQLRESKESATYHVISTKSSLDVATVVELDESGETVGEPQDMLKTDLVVVKPFGDPVYPGLRQVGEAGTSKSGQPTHVVINGENYHALQALEYTHAGKVDLIYIDPPYNTGNSDWKYNDRYIDSSDSYRHSKWLSFINKRLKTAKDLLNNSGIIAISIDDNEHHRLRMLMDSVFGEKNFVADLVWRKKATNGGIANGGYGINSQHEYILVYSKTSKVVINGVPASEGLDSQYKFSDENGRYRLVDLAGYGLSYSESMDYAISSPDGKMIRANDVMTVNYKAGWRWGRDKYNRHIEEIVWVNGKPKTKTYMPTEGLLIHPSSLLIENRFLSKSDVTMKTIFDEKVFDNPKSTNLITYLIGILAPTNGVVVDFFAGSGTTAEAVIRLNKEDGGTRQAILVTNNELSKEEDKKLRDPKKNDGKSFRPGDAEYEAMGVFHHVTMPRISTVLTGIRKDGSNYSDGIVGQSAAFFDLTYEDENLVSLGNKFESIAPLLWMESGAVGGLIAKRSDLAKGEDGYSVPADGTYAVIFDTEAAADAIEALHNDIKKVFIVTDSENDFKAITASLPGDLRNNAQRLYSSYLRSFEINR